MVEEDSHSTYLSVWLITVFGFNKGQSYLAALVTPQNDTTMLGNLIFVVQFAYFRIRNFLDNFEQLVESPKNSYHKISPRIL